jgi:glutamate racemase
MATSKTIESHYFKRHITKNIYELATPELVPLIENRNYQKLDKILNNYLKEYQNKIDTLVLGCTHYPIIKNNIKKVLPDNIKILDMSNFINIENNGNKTRTLYFSKMEDEIEKNIKEILGVNVTLDRVPGLFCGIIK